MNEKVISVMHEAMPGTFSNSKISISACLGKVGSHLEQVVSFCWNVSRSAAVLGTKTRHAARCTPTFTDWKADIQLGTLVINAVREHATLKPLCQKSLGSCRPLMAFGPWQRQIEVTSRECAKRRILPSVA